MKKFSLFVVLLVLVLALSAVPAQAQSQCGGNPNCVYAFVKYECYQTNMVPQPGTTQVQIKATDSTVVNTYTLVLESQGHNWRIYSATVTNVSSSKWYQSRFLRNGAILINWGGSWRPPTSTGGLYKYWC